MKIRVLENVTCKYGELLRDYVQEISPITDYASYVLEEFPDAIMDTKLINGYPAFYSPNDDVQVYVEEV